MDRDTWGEDGPPGEAYSRVTDPTRYLGLHPVADRVVDRLVARFRVIAEPAAIEGRWRGGVERATRIVPADGGAPLTVVWTGFGVVVRAGHAFERGLPGCGCDACDEEPAELATDLEEVLEAVAAGGLTETRTRRLLGADRYAVRLAGEGGHEERSGAVKDGDGEDVPVGTWAWPPWPAR